MHRISVIVPVYNQEKYLSECIESILNQTFSDFELIFINDGSTDLSDDICKRYASLDSRIKYINQDNQGVSAARNAGLKIAQGEYIYIMDSDDTIDAYFLEKAYNNAIINKSDIVVLGEDYGKRMPIPPALPVCAFFFKKSLYNFSNVSFPVGIQPCEDGLFSHQLIALTDKISLEKDCIYFYREHENQNHMIINKQCEKVLLQIPEWFEILKSFYDKKNLLSSKYIHLYKFIEHEPFEFRFLKMPFNKEQKEVLYNLMKDFIRNYIKINLKKDEYKNFTTDFCVFLISKNYKNYNAKLKSDKIKKKIIKFLINFIPNKKSRKKWRNIMQCE